MSEEREEQVRKWTAPKKKKKSIMEFFPYPEAREEQRNVLEALEKYWDNYDCFCIVAPTALGKSALMKTIAAWRGNASMIVPTNILVKQMAEAFPGLQKLQKRALYMCPRFKTGVGGKPTISCEEAYKKYGGKKLGCSRDCEYLRDNARARGRGYGVYNYYTYMANKLYKPTLIIDESHGIIRVLQDLGAKKLWKHDYHYPWDMWNSGDILNWIESLEEKLINDEELDETLVTLKSELLSSSPRYIIKRGRDLWERSQPPEERELLTMLPVDTSDAPPVLWPGGKVSKIVLLSATISYKDVEGMGLGRRRTLYLETASPIAPSLRKVYYDFVGAVNRNNIKDLTRKMAEKIRGEYLERYSNVKGVIHATYAQAKLFREEFGENPRFIFHTKEDAEAKLREFMEAPPESGKIFVASGMYEGLDLKDDLARWQIIAKVPWLNLGDPAVKYKAEQDNAWYAWEVGKALLQGCGRTTRNENDFSETFILDQSVERLIVLLEEYKLMPSWFRDVLPN